MIDREGAPRHLRIAIVGRRRSRNVRIADATPMPPTSKLTSPTSPRYVVTCVKNRRIPGCASSKATARTAGSVVADESPSRTGRAA